MLFTDAVARLEAAFTRALPGAAAHAALTPVPRRQWPAGFNPARIRDAAGLLLVFPKPATTINAEHAESAEQAEQNGSLRVPRVLRSSSWGDAHVVLTVRADTLGRHGGQVSLPGGGVEPGEAFEQAALREAHEEIGLTLERVRVLGALTPLDIPVSGFRLHPIVAIRETRPTLAPSDGEVARILEIAVDELLDPARLMRTVREYDGAGLTVPAFHVAGEEIWGATAMVLAEFLSLLGWTGGEAG
jgi:8-oxo-dGTP pyrophosphatase MutT (NUDIX family)